RRTKVADRASNVTFPVARCERPLRPPASASNSSNVERCSPSRPIITLRIRPTQRTELADISIPSDTCWNLSGGRGRLVDFQPVQAEDCGGFYSSPGGHAQSHGARPKTVVGGAGNLLPAGVDDDERPLRYD